MNRKYWQNAFGNAPEDFHLRLVETLDGLEEEKMKKRYRFSTVLIAAIIMVLLAGGAVAVNQLGGVFRLLTYRAEPIVPLEGAEEMVVTDLGFTENDLATLKVEEAVFDGQNVMLQLRLTPKDSEHHVMFDYMMQNAPRDLYEIEEIPHEDGSMSIGEITRKDGKQIIDYEIMAKSMDERIYINTADAEEQEDGGIIYWAKGEAETGTPVDLDALDVEIKTFLFLNGEEVWMDPITIQVPKAGKLNRVQFVPVGEQLDRVEILSAEMDISKLVGYINVNYRYEQLPEEEMGITFRFYDAEGNEIHSGDGGSWDQGGMRVWRMEIQPFATDDLPEKIWIEAKVIDGDPLGRIECDVVEIS